MTAPATTAITSFNGGEVSARMAGRTDLRRYFTSVKEMTGFLPLLQGPAQAAPGTIFVRKAKGPCRLIGFEPHIDASFVLELSANCIRIFWNNTFFPDPITPTLPFEVVTPWDMTVVPLLDYHESIDVCYFVSAYTAPQLFRRPDPAHFDLIPLALDGGPIGPDNANKTLTMGASATTGSVTVTASASVFAPGDVGRLIEIEAADFNDVVSWQPGMKTTNGLLVTWGGRVYQRDDGGGTLATGSNPPEHDTGSEWDGTGTQDATSTTVYGVRWKYLYGRFGLLKITAYTDSTHVTATVIDRLANSLTTTPSYRWALGAFSTTTGWPDSVTIWGESLVLFHSATSTGYVSVVGDLTNFRRRDSSGDFQHDLAGSFTLPGRDAVRWMEVDRLLLLGGAKAEYSVERIVTTTGAAGPPQFKVVRNARNGSGANIKPVAADGHIVFAQRAGRKLLDLNYTITSDRYEAPDTTRYADHIGAERFVDMAWQQEPERLLWAVRGDGSLASLTYMPSEDVMGWAPRTLGGGLLATSICRATDPQGLRDDIWLSATAGGETWILRMAKIWELGDDPASQWYVDAGVHYTGAPASTITLLDWLNGLDVEILADGIPHPIRTVTGNAVTLDWPASEAVIGLKFKARIVTMKLEAGNREGTAQGKVTRIPDVLLRVVESQGLRVSVLDPHAKEFTHDEDQAWLSIETRTPDDAMDEAVPLYTGDLFAEVVGCFDNGGTIAIERETPTNVTLIGIVPQIEVADPQ